MGETVSFNPGPSQLAEGVADDLREALDEGLASLSHRSDRFQRVHEEAVEAVTGLLELPDDYRVLFAASATEIMELLVRNLSGRRTFHACLGAFSKRFQTVADAIGREALAVEVELGEGIDLAEVDLPDVELACLTHVETSTGVEVDLAPLADWRARRPGALFAVDLVASAPTREHDWSTADAWFFSVQKACGLPAGLAVLIVSPRALERAAELARRGADQGFLRRLTAMAEKAERNQTVETPNVLALHLLGRGLSRLRAFGGIERIEQDTAAEAQRIYGWLEGHARLRPFVQQAAHRARTIAAIEVTGGASPRALRAALERDGLIVGAGYGPLRDTQVRIANYPAHDPVRHARLRLAIDHELGVETAGPS